MSSRWVDRLRALSRGGRSVSSRLGWGFALLAVAAAIGLSARASSTAQAQPNGEQIYLERCAFCHGEQGDGNGALARYLNPRPRDFTTGQFRFRTTASGELPLRSDVIATVARGVRGTAMPSWGGVLTDAEIEAVVDYLTQSFVPFWGTYDPPVIEIPNAPRVTEAMVEEGALLYDELQCWRCHGEEGRADGPSAPTLEDELNNPILPADLTKAWRYKGGAGLVDIYTRFSTGMDGTPMPSFYDVINDDQRWALAAFVRSLQVGQPTERSVLSASFVEGALPSTTLDPAWGQAEPTSIYLTGQVIVGPRWQTPGVDAVTARALYNASELALLLEWSDPTFDVEGGAEPGSVEGRTYVDLESFMQGPFADGFAVQLPNRVPQGVERPYFAWGQPGNPVTLWRWQADGSVQELTATGLAAELVPQETNNVIAEADWQHGRYQLLLRRPLDTGDPADVRLETGRFIPIAFQAWEGSRGEAGTRMSLSSWTSLRLERPIESSAYLNAGLVVAAVAAAEFLLVRRLRS